MEHSIESYLNRLSTQELEMVLQYYLKEPTQHRLEINEILRELQLRNK